MERIPKEQEPTKPEELRHLYAEKLMDYSALLIEFDRRLNEEGDESIKEANQRLNTLVTQLDTAIGIGNKDEAESIVSKLEIEFPPK